MSKQVSLHLWNLNENTMNRIKTRYIFNFLDSLTKRMGLKNVSADILNLIKRFCNVKPLLVLTSDNKAAKYFIPYRSKLLEFNFGEQRFDFEETSEDQNIFFCIEIIHFNGTSQDIYGLVNDSKTNLGYHGFFQRISNSYKIDQLYTKFNRMYSFSIDCGEFARNKLIKCKKYNHSHFNILVFPKNEWNKKLDMFIRTNTPEQTLIRKIKFAAALKLESPTQGIVEKLTRNYTFLASSDPKKISYEFKFVDSRYHNWVKPEHWKMHVIIQIVEVKYRNKVIPYQFWNNYSIQHKYEEIEFPTFYC